MVGYSECLDGESSCLSVLEQKCVRAVSEHDGDVDKTHSKES